MTRDKRQRVEQAVKVKELSRKRKVTAIVLVLLAIVTYTLGPGILEGFHQRAEAQAQQNLFQEKILLLETVVFQEAPESIRVTSDTFGGQVAKGADKLPPSVVFLSISDSLQRARVFTGVGNALEEAWASAVVQADAMMQEHPMDPKWLKADVVDWAEVIPSDLLANVLQPHRQNFFRKGISMDTGFETAFLEAELNGNDMIDYDNDGLALENINRYLAAAGRSTLEALPAKDGSINQGNSGAPSDLNGSETYVVFTTLGWFCDENSHVHPLYGYGENGYDVGRRVIPQFDRKILEEVIASSSQWLFNEIQEDGSFIYGYYPMFNERLTHYNILRHTVSIQPLIWYYAMTEDEHLIPQIESTLRYLVDDHIEYQNPTTAYVVDRPNKEIKLGGNAVAIIVLDLYMDTFETDIYRDVSVALGEGILVLMDQEQGTYYHVLNTDFTPKEAYRTVYYDGEATYALALLYDMTGDDKWLEAATAAVENFIRQDYTQYRDHWVAYAVNEVSKHIDEPRYDVFALENVSKNLEAIYRRDTSYHTYLELLMASFIHFDRMMAEGSQVPAASDFDIAAFIDTIFHRGEHMLNGYIYPEYSMYWDNPQKTTGSFAIRHDRYRVRIDDVEHFIAGYYNVWQHFQQLKTYQEEFPQQAQ